MKAFNTMTAAVMVNPGAVGGGGTTIFVAGTTPMPVRPWSAWRQIWAGPM